MDLIRGLIDFVLHIDQHLPNLIAEYGNYIYGILFLILFAETGLVVTPFLPGDSLLFAAGALTVVSDDGQGGLELFPLMAICIVAAIIGDAVNFWIGTKVGPGYLAHGKIRFIKKEYLDQAQAFYERHGGRAIVLARFVPIVRTFAPFVAGIGQMNYRRFATYNVVGAIAWVVICAGAGRLFGGIPIVKKNFEIVVLGIIGVSVLPIVVEVVRAKFGKPRTAVPTE